MTRAETNSLPKEAEGLFTPEEWELFKEGKLCKLLRKDHWICISDNFVWLELVKFKRTREFEKTKRMRLIMKCFYIRESGGDLCLKLTPEDIALIVGIIRYKPTVLKIRGTCVEVHKKTT